MGCVSSTPEEHRANYANIDNRIDNNNNPSNTYSAQQQQQQQHQGANPSIAVQQPLSPNHGHRIMFHPVQQQQAPSNDNMNINVQSWNCNDVISYICTLSNGKFLDTKYDTFKAGLISLDINGSSINSLCHDPNILRDIGLNDEMDIILIQTAFVSLFANDPNNNINTTTDIVKQPSLAICESDDDDNHEEEEYFPLEWKFPMDDNEKMKNPHYVGQKLMITNKYLQPVISKCIYIENNWIVIQYLQCDDKRDENENKHKFDDNTLNTNMNINLNELSLSNQSVSGMPSPTNHTNIYKDMEKLHVIKNHARIQKLSEYKERMKASNVEDNNNHTIDFQKALSEDTIFEKEYYGMSCTYSSQSIGVGAIIPDCYIDPITYEIMNDPVTSKTSGRTYDKKMIMEHLNEYGTDPFNQQPMKQADLEENKELKRAIDRWLQHNPQSMTIQ